MTRDGRFLLCTERDPCCSTISFSSSLCDPQRSLCSLAERTSTDIELSPSRHHFISFFSRSKIPYDPPNTLTTVSTQPSCTMLHRKKKCNNFLSFGHGRSSQNGSCGRVSVRCDVTSLTPPMMQPALSCNLAASTLDVSMVHHVGPCYLLFLHEATAATKHTRDIQTLLQIFCHRAFQTNVDQLLQGLLRPRFGARDAMQTNPHSARLQNCPVHVVGPRAVPTCFGVVLHQCKILPRIAAHVTVLRSARSC